MDIGKWFRELFKNKPELKRVASTGDFVVVTLREHFSNHALQHVSNARFDVDDLTTRTIRGTVLKNGFPELDHRRQFGNDEWMRVLELQVVKETSTGTVRYRNYSIMGDEIENIVILDAKHG